MMLTLISGWMRRAPVWIMATRDGHRSGFQVESLLSALPVGKGLVRRKANQAVKLKKNNKKISFLTALQTLFVQNRCRNIIILY